PGDVDARAEREGLAQERQQYGHGRRAERGDADERGRAAAVGEPADDSAEPGLDTRGEEEDGADPERSEAERVQSQRPEDAHDAEEDRGQRYEPHAADEAAVAEVGEEVGERLRLVRPAGRSQRGGDADPHPD